MTSTPLAAYAVQALATARADRLVIVRQSGVRAHADLHTLLERTYALYPYIPGADEIQELGIKPVLDPRPSDQVWRLPDGGTACLYEIKGTWTLLILGSAAAKNTASTVIDKRVENAVVNLMCEVVASLRPIDVYIGPFDRVNRSHAFSTQTFEGFRDAGVEVLYLEDQPGEIWFDSEDAEEAWYTLSKTAATNYRTTVKRTTSGKISMARRNLWYSGDGLTPVGLRKDADSRLSVDERDKRAVRLIVEGLAQDDSDAAIARTLFHDGALRRRRGGQWSRSAESFVAKQNETSRLERAVRLFRERMPDLALGKHVVLVKEPRSTNFTHRGVRRERSSTGHYSHVLVWDVPDIFEDIEEQVLDEALLVAVRRAVRAGNRPSKWVHEKNERERMLAELTEGVEFNMDARESVRRKQFALEMSRPIGSGPEHPRAARVRELIGAATAEAPRTNTNTSVPSTIRLFSGYQTWAQDDGHEYKLAAHLGETYLLLRRPSDSSTSVEESLTRPWGIKSGSRGVRRYAIAQFRDGVFHAALADAAARHIDQGVTVLSGRRAAASGIVLASQHLEAERVLRRQRLASDLADAERDVQAAKTRLRLITTYKMPATDGAEADADAWAEVNDDLLNEALREEVQARARAKRLSDALHAIADESVFASSDELPDLDDLDLTLQTLVALRTKVSALATQAHAIQALIPRLNVVSTSAFEVEFEMDLLLPTGSGGLPVGPIRFSVPTAGTRPAGYESWSHAECEELALRRLVLTDTILTRHGGTLSNGWLIPKTYVAQRAATYLMKRGVGQDQARYLLQTTLLLPRTIVYHLVHDLPINHDDLGTSDDYVDLIRRTYLDVNNAVPRKVPSLSRREELQHLLNVLKTLPHWRPVDIADYLRYPAAADFRSRDSRARTVLTYERTNLPALVARIGVKGLSREGKQMSNLTAYVLHQCPHCAEAGTPHPVDVVAWNVEVPGGILCSSCLRTPAPDSIVYPAAYGELLHTSWRPSAETPSEDGA